MSALASGTVIAGKYRLEREIGRGGMGSVWAARHLTLDTPVALKFIDPDASAEDAHLRFEREAKAAAQLRSPHVVQILDHGLDHRPEGELPYIAMELLDGEDLGERLRRRGRLSIPEAANIFGQAAKALRRAHDAGVIHRDLKPSNIFLARFDDDEVVKLLDFGVAKLRRGEMDPQNPATQTGVIFGSPTYMSPEQARGIKPIDHRSDLWSLAVILFRALTGQKPFEANSIGDLVIKLCIEAPPVPSRFAPDLPPEIDRFFERAFARDPDRRFPSAMAMAAELDAIAQRYPQGPSAEPPSARVPRPSATPPSGSSGGVVLPPFSALVPAAAPALLSPPPEAAALPAHTPATGSSLAAPVPPAAPPLPISPTPAMHEALPPAPLPPAPLAPQAAHRGAPSRGPLIAAVLLAACGLVFLVLVVTVLRGRGIDGEPALGSEATATTSSASTTAIPAPTIPDSAPSSSASTAAPAAPAADATTDAPASSATAEASAKAKPPPGKRGRVPNFGY